MLKRCLFGTGISTTRLSYPAIRMSWLTIWELSRMIDLCMSCVSERLLTLGELLLMIPNSPCEYESSEAGSSKPTPRSETRRWIASRLAVNATLASFAPLCLRPAFLPPRRALIQGHPDCPTGQACAAQDGPCPQSAKWSLELVFDHRPACQF